MADSIDAWYQRELEYLRTAGADFAQRYGKIADRLSLSATETQDPHVERLLQGVAFLNARVRQKLDDTFPELVDAILGILYPHLVSPIPSMSIVEFAMSPKQQDLVGGSEIPRGTALETERIDGFAGSYRTCSPVRMFPLTVQNAEILPPPFQGPQTSHSVNAESALHLTLQPFDQKKRIAEYEFETLRFYVDMSNFERAARLVELLSTNSLEVAISGEDPDKPARVLPASCLRQVGFDDDDAVLPTPVQSFPGYRLLTEYFILPRKFLFFEITGLTSEIRSAAGTNLDLWVYLKSHDKDLESLVRPSVIKLGCTPIVNLFQQTADAIPLGRNRSEYRLIPDGRAEAFKEIYTIDDVRVTDDDSEDVYAPFFSVSHKHGRSSRYWNATRRPGPKARDVGNSDGPSEVYMTLVDEQFRDLRESRGTLRTRLTCFNRMIPEQLSKRELSKIRWTPVGGLGVVGSIRCLVSPTRTVRQHLGIRNLWPLISQLSLNHLSLSGQDGMKALQEILRLNDPIASVHTEKLVSGLLEIQAEPCVARVEGVFARGTEIQFLLDDESYTGDSAYLFCSVIDRFLSMYSSLNSFTRTSANTVLRKEKGVTPWKWIPKVGHRPLI
ncbi:hypothetical protein KOR42_36200 [Thalassoglobus neptunius]|uniref:Type VI secretion system baseplate subunit TssF n=1 Tax=Thalassoglobus neptunius TaxID=1938619 RepID=A0A5C5WH01_9PLAN|nr:type VI secretion system baseplate subunit TssF [Thalassoglobus neptunius]TWT50074.1 hypothetical protein KOR42_36200 [Thalassoglobus neptunius]